MSKRALFLIQLPIIRSNLPQFNLQRFEKENLHVFLYYLLARLDNEKSIFIRVMSCGVLLHQLKSDEIQAWTYFLISKFAAEGLKP